MTDNEAMKLALEAVKRSDGFLYNWHENDSDDEADHYSTVRQLNEYAIKALEEALAKQEQGEPVAWRFTGIAGLKRFISQKMYEAQTLETKRWYEPFKCANCTTPMHTPSEPYTEAIKRLIEATSPICEWSYGDEMDATFADARKAIAEIEKQEQEQGEPVAKDDADIYAFWARNKEAEKRKPKGYAGITIWGGDVTVTKVFTEIQIRMAQDPSELIKRVVQQCLDELATHGIKE